MCVLLYAFSHARFAFSTSSVNYDIAAGLNQETKIYIKHAWNRAHRIWTGSDVGSRAHARRGVPIRLLISDDHSDCYLRFQVFRA